MINRGEAGQGLRDLGMHPGRREAADGLVPKRVEIADAPLVVVIFQAVRPPPSCAIGGGPGLGDPGPAGGLQIGLHDLCADIFPCDGPKALPGGLVCKPGTQDRGEVGPKRLHVAAATLAA